MHGLKVPLIVIVAEHHRLTCLEEILIQTGKIRYLITLALVVNTFQAYTCYTIFHIEMPHIYASLMFALILMLCSTGFIAVEIYDTCHQELIGSIRCHHHFTSFSLHFYMIRNNLAVLMSPSSNFNITKILWVDRFSKIKLGSNMPTRAELTVRKSECEPQIIGEPTGEFYDVILYFGIIDILQDYDISKKLEHAYKSFQYDPTSISAVDPKQYSRRFKDFVYKAFQEEKIDI